MTLWSYRNRLKSEAGRESGFRCHRCPCCAEMNVSSRVFCIRKPNVRTWRNFPAGLGLPTADIGIRLSSRPEPSQQLLSLPPHVVEPRGSIGLVLDSLRRIDCNLKVIASGDARRDAVEDRLILRR